MDLSFANGNFSASPVGTRLDNPCFRTWLLVAAALALYAPTLNGVFLWDDPLMLWDNPAVLARHGGLARIWSGREGPDYFPLTSSLFWLEWRVWGQSPFGYRLVNVLLHAGSAILLWRVLWRLRIPGAWLAGLLFALHPLAVGSVAWIAELKNTLSLPLFLLALLAYLRFDDGAGVRWYVLALGAFLLALLAKSSVVMLPILLLLLLHWRQGQWRWRNACLILPFLLLSLVLGLVTMRFQAAQAGGEMVLPGLVEGCMRLALAGRALWFYLGKTFAPVGLCAIYPAWQSDPRAWLAYLPVVAWGAVTGVAWLGRRQPPACALWLLLAAQAILLLPVLGLVNMSYHQYAWVADHLGYLAIPPACAFVGAAGSWLWRRLRPQRRAAAAVLGLLGVCGWLVAAHRQVRLYQYPEALWRKVMACNPTLAVGYHNAGEAVLREAREGRGDGLNPAVLGQARELFLAADRRAPTAVTCFYLGFVEEQLASPGEAERWFRRALELDPADYWAVTRLGLLLASQGRHAEAEGCFRTLVRLRPGDETARYNLGQTLVAQGRPLAAQAEFRAALRLRPDYPAARAALAALAPPAPGR